jgi:hypothetical protein
MSSDPQKGAGEAEPAAPRPKPGVQEVADAAPSSGLDAASPTVGRKEITAPKRATRKVDVEVRHADIGEVLQLLVEAGGQTLDGDVGGALTMRVRKTPGSTVARSIANTPLQERCRNRIPDAPPDYRACFVKSVEGSSVKMVKTLELS